VPKILVIDDNKALREQLVEILKHAGHTAVAADNGLEALKIVRADPIDLILTDILMPYDGLAMIRILHSEFPKIGIIAMSGAGAHRLDYARSGGAQVTLLKPFSAEQLSTAITEVLSRNAAPQPGQT